MTYYHRELGDWMVSVGEDDCGRMENTEDGPMWRSVWKWLVQAEHRRGRIYLMGGVFNTQEEAAIAAEILPADFDPETSEDWHFWRTAYGSLDWGPEDEFALMDEQERERFLRGGL